MADTENQELPSVIDYGEDIANAKPPVPLPKGKYRAEIRDAKSALSRTSGNLYADVTFFIDASKYPADFTDGDPDGIAIHYRMVSLEKTPRARWLMKQFVQKIGAPSGASVDLNDWIGREAIIKIDHTKDQAGLLQPEIREITPVGG
jgi:hypothetical protein